MENTLAYYDREIITAVKCIIILSKMTSNSHLRNDSPTMTLSKTMFGIMTIIEMTRSVMTPGITTLNIVTLRITTFNIVTLNITTLS